MEEIAEIFNKMNNNNEKFLNELKSAFKKMNKDSMVIKELYNFVYQLEDIKSIVEENKVLKNEINNLKNKKNVDMIKNERNKQKSITKY